MLMCEGIKVLDNMKACKDAREGREKEGCVCVNEEGLVVDFFFLLLLGNFGANRSSLRTSKSFLTSPFSLSPLV